MSEGEIDELRLLGVCGLEREEDEEEQLETHLLLWLAKITIKRRTIG